MSAHRTCNRSTWRAWSAFLADLPLDAERERWRAAYEVAAALLPDTDPMWIFHPHDWTPRDIENQCRDYARTARTRTQEIR